MQVRHWPQFGQGKVPKTKLKTAGIAWPGALACVLGWLGAEGAGAVVRALPGNEQVNQVGEAKPKPAAMEAPV